MFGIGRCFPFGSRGGFGFGTYSPGGISWMLPLAMGVFRIILFIIIIYFIYKIFNKYKENQYSLPSYSTAMQILNERFAKGEISEEEYNSKKKQLQM